MKSQTRLGRSRCLALKPLLAASLASLAACGQSAPDDDTGSVVAEIRLAPTDARCIQLKTVGATTVTQSFDVAPEATSVLTLKSLPPGNVTISAAAFSVACASVTATTVATYVGDPISVTVTISNPVNVTFQLRANVAGTATVEFPTRGQVTEFTLNGGSGALGITSGPDGNLWFSENSFTRIGRLTPSLVFTDIPGLSAGAATVGIVAAPDGNLWFTENGSGMIGRMTPTGTLVEFPLAAGSLPRAPVVGADGNVWFVDNGKIERITPWGAVTTFASPGFGNNDLAACGDGNLWFTATEPNLVGRVTPAGVVTSWPQTFQPFGITCTPDGKVWVIEEQAGQIAQGTTAGFATGVTHFATGVAQIADLAPGPDGAAWFVAGVGAIGRVAPFVAWGTPRPNSGANRLTVGPDGAFWFTQSNGTSAAIGRLLP